MHRNELGCTTAHADTCVRTSPHCVSVSLDDAHRARRALDYANSPVLERSVDSAHELQLNLIRREGECREVLPCAAWWRSGVRR